MTRQTKIALWIPQLPLQPLQICPIPIVAQTVPQTNITLHSS
ncbi:hypothetical protein D915_010832 [Fasciola hepatica]|uniref:Uncharacterized protein n=1 Tax=Fasciola hepatica TaxID=6192 RepID=A0A4E0QTU9_FASHE|nr:hypothetical protein D915_010832 [Fasciola hepatica]